MTVKWTDVTSYRKGEPRIANCWQANIHGLRVTVLNAHMFAPDKYIMFCEPWFDTYDLGLPATLPVHQAQQDALGVVLMKLRQIVQTIDREFV